MKNLILVFTIFTATATAAHATHNLGAYITYKHVSGNTYEFTVTTYTDSRSMQADRPEIFISWGDGTGESITRCGNCQVSISTTILKNTYTKKHTYLKAGTYKVAFQDANRATDILNIKGSGTQAFYVETEILADENISNNSLNFSASPSFYIKNGQNAILPLSIINADADSVSIKLITPKKASGKDVDGYNVPKGAKLIYDRIYWEPSVSGSYVFTVLVEEYKNCKKVGAVMADWFVTVNETDLSPLLTAKCPETDSLNICRINASAGDTVFYEIRLADSKATGLVLEMYTPHLFGNQPQFIVTEQSPDVLNGIFKWKADQQPNTIKQDYRFIFRGVVKDTNAEVCTDKLVYITVDGALNKQACITGFKKESQPVNGINIFPNPFTYATTVTLNETAAYTIKLYDLNGRLLQVKNFNGNSTTLEKENMSPGVYIVHISAPGKIPSAAKLIIH